MNVFVLVEEFGQNCLACSKDTKCRCSPSWVVFGNGARKRARRPAVLPDPLPAPNRLFAFAVELIGSEKGVGAASLQPLPVRDRPAVSQWRIDRPTGEPRENRRCCGDGKGDANRDP